ncbi:MAG: hypothetical protein ACLR6O_04360 [Eubacterium sp.]
MKSNGFKIAVASSNSRDVVLQHLRDTGVENILTKYAATWCRNQNRSRTFI